MPPQRVSTRCFSLPAAGKIKTGLVFERRLSRQIETAHGAKKCAMIQVKCEGCALNFEAPYEAAGRKGRCPHCGAVSDIPGEPEGKKEAASERKAVEKRPPALIPCPACGNKISNSAESCPGCGHKTAPDDISGEKSGCEVLIPLLEDIIAELKKASGEY